MTGNHHHKRTWRGRLLRRRSSLTTGAVAIALFAAVTVALSPLGGQARQWIADRLEPAADDNLVLREIRIAGAVETAEETIRAAIGAKTNAPLLKIDLEAAQERIEALPWVRRAAITRQLPDRMIISIEEYTPFARWQTEGTVWLVSRRGERIIRGDLGRWSDLRLFVGEGAAAAAADLEQLLARAPSLAERVTAVIRVADRRWNLRFESGIDVMLPAASGTYGPDEAWVRFAEAERRHRLLDRAISVLDLRFPDRLIVRVTPDGRAIADGLEQAT